MGNQPISIDVWDEKYTLDGSVESLNFEDEEGKFETFGPDLDHVLNVVKEDPKRVWTEVDGDGGIYLISGYHLVNRNVYYITKEPCEAEFEEYLVERDYRFNNRYHCPCGAKWDDESDHTNNDKCYKCRKEIEPYESEDMYD